MSAQSEEISRYVDSVDPSGTALQALLQQITSQAGSVHIIVSVGSGDKTARAFYDLHIPKLLGKFGLQPVDFHTYVTQSEHTITELADTMFSKEASAGRPLLIIILSGDGGVIDILNSLAPAAPGDQYVAPFVALVPLGTANALAHSSLVADDTLGLRALVTGQPRNLPNFRVRFSQDAKLLTDEARKREDLPRSGPQPLLLPDGSSSEASDSPTLYGAVVCSWGLHAAIVADSDTAEFRKHGIDRFKMAANEALYPADGNGPHQYAGSVFYKQAGKWREVPGHTHGYVLATTVSNLEKTFTISPATTPLDGSIHLVQFGSVSGDKAMEIMGQAYNQGNHVKHEAVTYESVDALWVRLEEETGNDDDDGQRWRRVCVDGKIIVVTDRTKEGWFLVEKNPAEVLRLLVPVGQS